MRIPASDVHGATIVHTSRDGMEKGTSLSLADIARTEVFVTGLKKLVKPEKPSRSSIWSRATRWASRKKS